MLALPGSATQIATCWPEASQRTTQLRTVPDVAAAGSSCGSPRGAELGAAVTSVGEGVVALGSGDMVAVSTASGLGRSVGVGLAATSAEAISDATGLADAIAVAVATGPRDAGTRLRSDHVSK